MLKIELSPAKKEMYNSEISELKYIREEIKKIISEYHFYNKNTLCELLHNITYPSYLIKHLNLPTSIQIKLCAEKWYIDMDKDELQNIIKCIENKINNILEVTGNTGNKRIK